MRLKKIIFNNFRQFYGIQEIDLDISNDKNIILIHGENGSGKTTILEGFSWCLYGEINLIHKNNILNEKVFFDLKYNDFSEVRVSLIFNDRNKEYIVSRFATIGNLDNKQYLKNNKFIVMQNGKESSNPTTIIDKIMSKDLKKYFFFDGERIDKLAKPENAKDIEDGIKNIMGINIYENAMRHLREVRKELNNDLKKISSKENISPYEEQSNIQNMLDETRKRLKNYIKSKDSKKEELKEIREAIKAVEELEKDGKHKEKIESEKEKLREKLSNTIKTEHKTISKESYLAISHKLIKDMNSFLEEKREKGELPSGIREQFIKDLIKEKKCICGREIKQDDEHYKYLIELLNNTVKKNIEDGFLKLSAFSSKYLDSKDSFLEKIQDFNKQKNEIIEELDKKEGELSDIKLKIKEKAEGSSSEQLISKEESIEDIIEELTEKIGEYKNNEKEFLNTLASIEIAIEKHQAENRQIEIAEKRLELCKKSFDKINKDYESAVIKVKDKLSSKISKVFNSIVTAYDAKINDKFQLSITKNINGNEISVATSTGENQIASLSFIGALVNIAREWDLEGKNEILTGAGIYPIVMDSPFGSLDSEYRDLISANLRILAPQIILFVSTSQWSNEVETNLKPYINHEYILQYHNPKQEEFNEDYKSIKIDDTIYDLSVKSDYEYTKIIKVK